MSDMHYRAHVALLKLGCVRQAYDRLTINESSVRQLEAMARRVR